MTVEPDAVDAAAVDAAAVVAAAVEPDAVDAAAVVAGVVEVVCLGETMALLVPDPPVRLVAAERLTLGQAGAESNVAVALAGLGTSAQWCSRVGDDPFGRRILHAVGAAGVDTATVRVDPDARTGVFFKDPDGDATTVRYYRDGSAASAMDDSDVDRALAASPRVLHLSGITAALSASCAAAVEHAVERAHALGCTVSFDVNHRPALWPDADVAARELLRLAQSCDIVFVGLDEAARLWGTTTEDQVRDLLSLPSVLVVKDGARSATGYEHGGRTDVAALEVQVLDAVGAGDAFAAGWLHAWLTGMQPVERLRLGHLVAARTLTSVTDQSAQPASLRTLPRLARFDQPWPPSQPQPTSGGTRTMTDDDFFTRHLGAARVLAILRGHGPQTTLELCRRAWDLGIVLVEIPVQSADDLEALRLAVAAGAQAGRLVGAGTVTSPELVATVAAAGAAFTVAPGLDEQVAAASIAAGLPHLPGVGSGTEVHRALGLGLTWQKAFPAAALGTEWVSAMRGPFPQVRLVATGGIDLGNAAGFLAAGAAAVSLGSAFASAGAAEVRGLLDGGDAS